MHNVTLTCLLLPLQHCLGPDDEFLPLQDGGMAAASCSYVPSDDAGTPAMAYDSTVAPANVA